MHDVLACAQKRDCQSRHGHREQRNRLRATFVAHILNITTNTDTHTNTSTDTNTKCDLEEQTQTLHFEFVRVVRIYLHWHKLMCTYIYIYIYIYMSPTTIIHIYIYIYVYRERERYIVIVNMYIPPYTRMYIMDLYHDKRPWGMLRPLLRAFVNQTRENRPYHFWPDVLTVRLCPTLPSLLATMRNRDLLTQHWNRGSGGECQTVLCLGGGWFCPRSYRASACETLRAKVTNAEIEQTCGTCCSDRDAVACRAANDVFEGIAPRDWQCVYICIYMYICIYVYVYVCTYIYIYIHINHNDNYWSHKW